MNLTENFRIALRALTANKMRSILTMLGIIIGVGAVVALLAVGNGAAASITQEVEGIGSNMITVMPGRFRMGPAQSSGQSAFLYYEDYQAIRSNVGSLAASAPMYQSLYTVKYGDKSAQATVIGSTPAYALIRSYSVAAGRFLSDKDGEAASRVAVLGSQTAADFFGALNPVGRQIKINGVPFEVIGVLQSKGSSGLASADDVILIPLETGYEKLFGSAASDGGKRRVSSILVSSTTSDSVAEVTAQIDYILRHQHDLSPTADADFSVMSQNDILSTLNGISTTLTIFLGAIAAISLLVGGIGIMNIMLVSVTERTREIGLRKAVGAKRLTILAQFLVETLLLSVLGGLLGISLGVGVAVFFTMAGLITAQVQISSILLAFSFAVAVGLFFGIYPAYRASSLRPMDALRYE